MNHRDIVAEYKKQGLFDTKRKQWFDSCADNTSAQDKLNNLIQDLIKCKIEKDPALLLKNSGKVSAFVQTELVKRQVQKAKQNSTNNSTQETSTIDKETDLLDAINDLLEQMAADASAKSAVSLEELKKLVE